MKLVNCTAFATAILLQAVLSWPAGADDLSDCEDGRGATAVRGCSRVIAAGEARGKPLTAKNRAVAYLFRGVAYHAIGENKKALADLDQVIKINPRMTIAYVSRGNVHHAEGEHDKAITDYTLALKLDPKNVVAHSNRGVVYKDLGDLDRAMADLNRAIKINPRFGGAYHSRGHVHIAAERLHSAIGDFVLAVTLNRKDGRFHHSLGNAYFYAGDEEAAQMSWRRACVTATPDLVRTWQTRLQTFKIYTGKVDGQCGSATIDAFRACAKRKCNLWPLVKLRQAGQ